MTKAYMLRGPVPKWPVPERSRDVPERPVPRRSGLNGSGIRARSRLRTHTVARRSDTDWTSPQWRVCMQLRSPVRLDVIHLRIQARLTSRLVVIEPSAVITHSSFALY